MNLTEEIKSCNREEELKHVFIKYLNLKLDTKLNIDCLTSNIIFEFKVGNILSDKDKHLKTLSQSLYYLKKLKNHETEHIRKYICLVDSENVSLYESKYFMSIIENEKDFDWFCSASEPDKNIIKYLKDTQFNINLEKISNEFFINKVKEINEQTILVDYKKEINKDNYLSIFNEWKNIFKVIDDYLCECFITDCKNKSELTIEDNLFISDFYKYHKFNNKVDYNCILYKLFWLKYEKPISKEVELFFINNKDTMLNGLKRKETGSFYTPLQASKLLFERLQKLYGEKFYLEYKIWDMCCGTGNLEYYIPDLRNVYMSTLEQSDINLLKNNSLFKDATIFQYDYLNDDVDQIFSNDFVTKLKMSLGLKNDLDNKNNKWIILINPPYVNQGGFKYSGVETRQESIYSTNVSKIMKSRNLNRSSGELYNQFLYRILHEFENRTSIISCLLPATFLIGPGYIKLRNIFKYSFKDGFCFPCSWFNGISGWNIFVSIFESGGLLSNEYCYDEYNDINTLISHSVKKIYYIPQEKRITSKLSSNRENKKLPVLKVSRKNKEFISITEIARCHDNSIGTISCGADLKTSCTFGNSILFTGSKGGTNCSITPTNFEELIIIPTVFSVIEQTDSNINDILTVNDKEIDKEFIIDSVILNNFVNGNRSVSFKKLCYNEEFYSLSNELYIYNLDTVKKLKHNSCEIIQQLETSKDRFISNYLKDKKLSNEANEVYLAGLNVYKYFYEHIDKLDFDKFKLGCWDVGFYQIKNSLIDKKLAKEELLILQDKIKILIKKLEPFIYEYGFYKK